MRIRVCLCFKYDVSAGSAVCRGFNADVTWLSMGKTRVRLLPVNNGACVLCAQSVLGLIVFGMPMLGLIVNEVGSYLCARVSTE